MLPPERRSAFSLIELLSAIAVLAILGTLVVAVSSKARDRSAETRSLANLRTIGTGLALYAADNEGRYPVLSQGYVGGFWTISMEPYVPTAKADPDVYLRRSNTIASQVFLDPLLQRGDHHFLGDYGANNSVIVQVGADDTSGERGYRVLDVVNPQRLITVMSAQTQHEGRPVGAWYMPAGSYVASGATQPAPSDRGRGTVQSLFADGHVESIPFQSFYDRRADLLTPGAR